MYRLDSTYLEHTQILERCIELDYLFCMGKGVLTMAFPNNPINRNGFDKNIPTTQGKAITLPPNQADIASFKAQLSIANNKVVIGNSNELHEKLQYYASNPPQKEALLQLKSGNYKMPSSNGIDKAFPVTNLKNTSIEALDENNKPRIERIVLTNPKNVHFKNIDFGVSNKRDWNHKNDGQTAIAINNGKNISIDNADISGMYDGINLKKGTTNFTLRNSKLHDLRRDAIISTDSRNTYILDNEFSAFHPNYENYNLDNRKHFVKDKKGVGTLKQRNVVYLTEKLQIPTDHADISQFTNQDGDLIIRGNTMSAKDGAWVQGVFIHNKNKGKDSDEKRSSKIIIKNNIIQNNYKMGIAVHGQKNVHEDNNTILTIKTKGRSNVVKPKVDLNYGGYNKK